ncbi:MAG: bifunctional nuclease family protein [Nitrospiraceae bacterium]
MNRPTVSIAGLMWSAVVASLVTGMPAGQVVRAEESGKSAQLVEITDVRVRVSEQGPVVLLLAEGRAIPIFVDATVAGSIHGALTGEKLPRPMSHDLMHNILEAFGGRVLRTVITLKDGTYYGALTVAMNGLEKVFDSRSSDSIALAVHFKAPILVGRDLLESAAKMLPEFKKQEL